MSSWELQFCMAGLEIQLRCNALDGQHGLLGAYGHYPSSGRRPDLMIEVEQIPGFADTRAPNPEHPGFHQELAGGVLRLSRWDAEGHIELPAAPAAEPVRARFRVSESKNAVEAAIRVGLAVTLPPRGGLILHASAVDHGAGALVFAGVSGAGKSTIARLLCEPPNQWRKLSDELLVVTRSTGGFVGHVTPFIGSAGLAHGSSSAVRGIYVLEQAATHRLTPMPRTSALSELARHVLGYTGHPSTAAATLDLVASLTATIPCYRLEFAKEPSVAEVFDITC